MAASNVLSTVAESAIFILHAIYLYLEAGFRLIFPPPLKSIEDETILVTGAVGGIGQEICKQLVQCASKVKLILWDINLKAIEKLAKELRKYNGKAEIFSFAVDLGNRDNVIECCQKVKDSIGPVTIIFNNAGVAPRASFLDQTEDQIENAFHINLFSHFWIIRQFLPDMIAANHGHIVNICTAGAIYPGWNGVTYFSSKYAVNGYSEMLKGQLDQLGKTDIHVSIVYPYIVRTAMTKGVNLESPSNNWLPSVYKKLLKAEDVAAKTVEGMRRNKEYIYAPGDLPLFGATEYLLPRKLRKVLRAAFQNCLHFQTANSPVPNSIDDSKRQ